MKRILIIIVLFFSMSVFSAQKKAYSHLLPPTQKNPVIPIVVGGVCYKSPEQHADYFFKYFISPPTKETMKGYKEPKNQVKRYYPWYPALRETRIKKRK